MGLGSDRICRYATFTLLIIFLVSIQPIYVQAQKTATLSGTVVDENREPIRNAVIRVFGPRWTQYEAKTDSSGSFQILVNREGWYRVYATCDRPETPGVDYVPSLWKTYLQIGSSATFMFTLERGASLYLDDEIRLVESSKPADSYRFTVTDLKGEPLSGKYSVYTYGKGTELVWRGGFDERLIVIPADREVAIRVDASISVPRVSRTFIIKGKPGYFKLPQGEKMHIASMEYVLGSQAKQMKEMWDSTFYLLNDAERAGFLVLAERQDLMDAYGLIDASLLSMKKRLYEEAFAKLRNAYVLTSRTIERLQGLIQISSQSALLLIPIFAFIASSSAYLITKRESCIEILSRERKMFSVSINLLISILFYSILILTFYLAYPGCRLISQSTFLVVATLVFAIGQAVVARLPRLIEKGGEARSIQFGSALVLAFSMACRNLRRRKLRTLLNLANMMILIFGFITLTSISPGFGLITRWLQPSLPEHALLIRDRIEGSEDPFLPLPSSFLTWLEDQPNVTLVAPKAENVPDGVIGNLYTVSGDMFPVRGILGIVPSAEANLTHLDETIVSGDYLRDDDLNGILISSSLRETLGVDVGDKLYGFNKEFTIRGFFDKRAIETLRDIDGQLLIPRSVAPMTGIIYCSGDEIYIVTYNASLTLPRVVTSRVNVQLRNPGIRDYSEFAQLVALSREYHVYISHPDSLQLHYIGNYLEEKGAVIIPFLMFLVIVNVSTIMLRSVSERREEIASLSSVGLNPTHISALFIAEAAVIGFVGGGLGYLLGIIGYRTELTTWFGALQVREKASAEWGLMALLISGFTAIIASVVPSLKASIIVTPSLLRKWSIGKEVKPREKGQPWVLDLPVKLSLRELEPFTGFIYKRMRERRGRTIGDISDIHLEEEESERGPLRRLKFRCGQQSEKWSTNELVIQRAEAKDFFEAKLLCIPSMNSADIVRVPAAYMRNLILEWNAMKFQVATPCDPSLSHLYTLVNAYNPSSLYIAATQPISEEKIDSLKKRLVIEGLRPPRIVISRVNASDMEECMKVADELASRADVVCISGGPDTLCAALAMSATIHGKMICSVVDPRPAELRMRDPFRNLKIVNVQPKKG